MTPKANVDSYTNVELKTCAECGKTFGTTHDTNICGQYEWWAGKHFTAQRWESQIRMAKARLAAGFELSPIDLEACRRQRIDPTTLTEEP